jgi:hypothetical protein
MSPLVDRAFSREGSSEGRIIWDGVYEYGGCGSSSGGNEATTEI